MNGICRVCQLVDKDEEIKTIEYCFVCDAWICKDCEPKLLKRAKAKLIEMTNKIRNAST